MDAAGADDHHQPVVGAVEDAGDLGAVPDHGVLLLGAERQVIEDLRRGDELDRPLDPAVANTLALLSR